MTDIARADNIALFDLDGTLCDHDGQLFADLDRLKAPEEPVYRGNLRNAPEHIRRRAELLREQVAWWTSLPRLQLGFDIMGVADELGYRKMILTQGPSRYPNAWIGKKLWVENELGPDTDITITRDKGLVYGKVLVDDFPDYLEKWLAWRTRGLAIMPASQWNANYEHKQVLRYDGTNIEQVREALALRLEGPVDLSKLRRKEGRLRTIT